MTKDSSDIREIKVKSFCTNHQLITIVGIDKIKLVSLELSKLKEIFDSSDSEVKEPKPNVVYVCKTGSNYERCMFLEINDNLAKSLTVLLLDCKSEIQISPEQVSIA